MQEKIVIKLSTLDNDQIDWVIVTDAGVALDIVTQGDKESLQQACKDREVIVVVPTQDVLLTNALLPIMSRAKLLQAIPYSLEEQVIDDVDNMHFAVSKQQPGGEVSVAIVSKEKMQAWMSLFLEIGVAPDLMLPRVLAMPYKPGVWHIDVDEIATIRTGESSGFACDVPNLDQLLTLAMSEESPSTINLQHQGDEAVALDVALDVYQRSVSQEEMLNQLATYAVGDAPINLLQGEFANKKSRRLPKMTNVLKVSAYLAVAWLVIVLVYPIISYVILSQSANDTSAQIAVIYKRQFPQASRIVAPKQRMQQKLNQLTTRLSDNQLLLLMAGIGEGLSKSQGVSVKRLDYQGNMITLEVLASTSQAISRFTDELTQQGLDVKQQNADLTGKKVSATLQIQ